MVTALCTTAPQHWFKNVERVLYLKQGIQRLLPFPTSLPINVSFYQLRKWWFLSLTDNIQLLPFAVISIPSPVRPEMGPCTSPWWQKGTENWRNDNCREKPTPVSLCHHKFHMYCPGTEAGTPPWEADDQPPESWVTARPRSYLSTWVISYCTVKVLTTYLSNELWHGRPNLTTWVMSFCTVKVLTNYLSHKLWHSQGPNCLSHLWNV